ncbi:MAG: hypothetical protein LBM97_01205 [Candidatus Nomurabacteria bacterium]|jgi:hypothetical protein|nr:hypothetical protein [Candidatus Nomurabacteria bacterium]
MKSINQSINQSFIAGVAAVGVAALVATPVFAVDPATWNQTVQVTTNSVITISSTAGSPVTIAVDPSSGGFGTTAVPITVASNNATGYGLTLSMISTDAKNGALFDTTASTTDVIAGASGTLTANQWGYYVGSSSTDIPTVASTFSQVPASSSPADLMTATTQAGSTTVYVNYGAVVDYNLESGITYSNQVTYTASVQP